MFSKDNILQGLQSKDKIKEDWYNIWNKTDDKNKSQSFSVGAERVIYYYLSNSKILGDPNSTPVSADLMFEVEDAFIHIDLKTVQTSNIGDFNTNIFVGNNQTSYKSKMIVNKEILKYKAACLPQYYSYVIETKEYKKPCLTYFITILHDEKNLETLVLNIMSMPNGQLVNVYNTEVLKAGKTVNKAEREEGFVSTVRYNFSECNKFKLLNSDRIKVVYFKDNMDKKYLDKLLFLHNIYKKVN